MIAAGPLESLERVSIEEFLDHLVGVELLKPVDRARILAFSKETGMSPCRVITHLGLLRESILARLLSEQLDLPLLAGDTYPDEPVQERPNRLSYLLSNGAMPIAVDEHAVSIAVTDPFDAVVPNA